MLEQTQMIRVLTHEAFLVIMLKKFNIYPVLFKNSQPAALKSLIGSWINPLQMSFVCRVTSSTLPSMNQSADGSAL